LDLVVPQSGERLLDIGCGTGNNLQIFREKWCSLTGLMHPEKNWKLPGKNTATASI